MASNRASFSLAVVMVMCMLACAEGAKILLVFHMGAPSHNSLGWRLAGGLAAKGHQVTFVGSIPHKDKIANVTDVLLDTMDRGMEEHKRSMYDVGKKYVWQQVLFVHMMATELSERAVQSAPFQRLLNSDQKFDLVVTEMFFNEFHFGLAHKFNCPLVVFSTVGPNGWVNPLVGNPMPMSYIPDLFLHYSERMTFFERMHNVVYSTALQVFRALYYFPQQDRLLHKYFGEDAPPLDQLMRQNVSMVLANSNSALGAPRPIVPAMVEVGGFHVPDVKPLPADLQKWLDDGKSGVILFSMGSNLKSANLPAEKRDAILRVFGRLEQRVLWKWETEEMENKPRNVRLMKWLPQNDVMAHPNVRVFITHGGLLSTTEATHHGVPVVGIPIFGDQKSNIAAVQLHGYGLKVDFEDLTEEALLAALREVISNPKYRENVRKRSAVLRDQPLRPLDAAVFWMEHVIRHGGAQHFRSAALDLNWCQLYLVDVIGVLLLGALLVTYALWRALRWLCCSSRPKVPSRSKDAAKKKKN